MGCCQDFTNRLQRLKNQVLNQVEGGNKGGQRERNSSGGVSVTTKLCFAVGGAPFQLTTVAINIALQIFLLDVVQMQPYYVSMILFVGRIWDAVTDPVIGYLVSHSKRTRIGKFIPWLVLSCPLGILSYLLLWFQPHGSMSESGRVLWFFTMSCLFETLMSCYNVPYLSLNMFLGGDQRDRDSATAYRITAELVAMVLASVIQGRAVAVFNREKQEVCVNQTQETAQSASSPQTAALQETRQAFLTSSLVLGAVFFLCMLVLLFGVKEQPAPVCSVDKVRPPLLTSLKMLICHIPYQRVVLAYVFGILATQMAFTTFALFCSHVAGMGTHIQYLLLAMMLSSSGAIPLWQLVLLRIGKRATVMIGLSTYIPAMIIIACVPSNFPVLVFMSIISGFGTGALFLLPWSMLPDVVDDFAMRHPSCRDMEPLFFSCYAFCNKLAGGLASGISTLTLQFVGYRSGACHHGDAVVTALTVLTTLVPVALVLVAVGFFWFYPIDERQLYKPPTSVQPEDTPPPSSSSSSPPSDLREAAEEPTDQQPHADAVASDSHNITKSSVSACSSSRDQKRSVKSDRTRGLPAGQGRSKPARHSGVKPQSRSGGAGRARNVPAPFSSRSKVSWV